MIRTSLVSLFALFILAVADLAQPGKAADITPGLPDIGHMVMGGTATLKSGVWLHYKAVVSNASNPSDDIAHGLGEGGLAVSRNTIHRWMSHKVKETYFGYDLTIGEGNATNGYLLSFGPFTDEKGIWMSHDMTGDPLKGKRMPSVAGLTYMPLAKYPAPQIVHDGDIIALDLMISPDGTQKLTDYIEIFSHEPEPPAAKTTAEPRDFSVDDGPVKFDTLRSTVWKQGREIAGARNFTTKPGSTLWIALPGLGRYILSLVPHEGFTKAGAVRDNVISFQDAGQDYEIRFMSPIAGAGKAWNVYVMHDPAYVPKENVRQSINMGVERLDSLLAK